MIVTSPTKPATPLPDQPGTDAPDEPGIDVAAQAAPAVPQPRRVPSSPASAPRIVRPPGLTRAPRPADIPSPAHSHLPGWVRRAYAQARPILGDLVGQLEGPERERLSTAIANLTAGMSAGKFSLAWQYSRLIDEGQSALEAQRQSTSALQEQRRALEATRRRLLERLRDSSARLAPEVLVRLERSVRAAREVEVLAAVEAEVDQAVGAARAVAGKRRDREIGRTRTKIMRASPRSGFAPDEVPEESWQDVLRRLTAGQTDSPRE